MECRSVNLEEVRLVSHLANALFSLLNYFINIVQKLDINKSKILMNQRSCARLHTVHWLYHSQRHKDSDIGYILIISLSPSFMCLSYTYYKSFHVN